MSATPAAAPESSGRRRARMDTPPRRGGRSAAGDAADPTVRSGRALLRAVSSGARLTTALLRDARVPPADKLAATAALVYLVSPVDLIADVLPVVGHLDDLGVIVWSWRRLLQAAGADVIEDLWTADGRSLDLVLAAAGLDE